MRLSVSNTVLCTVNACTTRHSSLSEKPEKYTYTWNAVTIISKTKLGYIYESIASITVVMKGKSLDKLTLPGY